MYYKSFFQFTLQITLLSAASLSLTGCAVNGLQHKPKVIGDDIANYQIDLQQCQHAAAQNKDLEKTSESAITGAVTGILTGVISNGDVISNALVGAIIGLTGGNYYSQTKQKNYIIKCMQDLGYNVVAND